MTAVTAAMADLEAQLDEVIRRQKEASSRHDKALANLKDALDRLARVYNLQEEDVRDG